MNQKHPKQQLDCKRKAQLKHQQQPQQQQTGGENSQQDYILQLTSLNNLTAAYSTSTQVQPTIELIQAHPNSSVFHSSSKLTVDHHEKNLGSVTQLKYSSHHSLLFAGFSTQSTLLGWDLRAHSFNKTPVIQLDGACNSPFTCLDYCAEAQSLVGGSTNEADSSETQIEIFDLRGTSKKPICVYDQAHSDSITNLKFDPRSSHRLLSASIDGLLILHDTRIQDQDQSILSVGNVGASVATVRFSLDQESIWCGTDMETLSLWDSNHLTLLKDFGDLRQDRWAYPNSSWNEPVSFLINLADPSKISPASQSAYFAGSQSGNVVLVDTTDTQDSNWRVLGSYQGGHTEMVRCATTDEQCGLVLTGGEDGKICLWSTHEQDHSQKLATPSVESKSKRFNPY